MHERRQILTKVNLFILFIYCFIKPQTFKQNKINDALLKVIWYAAHGKALIVLPM